MMLPDWLPAAAGLTFLAVTAARSLVARLRDGINPYVIDHSRPLEGFLGTVFVVLVLGLAGYLAVTAARPDLLPLLGPAEGWRLPAAILMAAAVVWTGWVQFLMGASWRVGIPEGETLALRTDGPFGLSRNPIYVGMLGFLTGLAMWSPNMVTVAALAVGYVAVEVQVRLEEAYLLSTHGDAYEAYRRKVRRWL